MKPLSLGFLLLIGGVVFLVVRTVIWIATRQVVLRNDADEESRLTPDKTPWRYWLQIVKHVGIAAYLLILVLAILVFGPVWRSSVH